MGILGMEIDSVIVQQDHDYYGRNLVGLAFLKKFIITIDWVHHQIYLKPIRKIHFNHIYTYGFTCWRKDKQLSIVDVYKDSELYKAGVKSGDIIVSINKEKNFSDELISDINVNKPGNDSIQIEMKSKLIFTLKKKRIFYEGL